MLLVSSRGPGAFVCPPAPVLCDCSSHCSASEPGARRPRYSRLSATGPQLDLCPEVFFLKFELTDAATGNKGNWLEIPSHHIPPCLSTPEPPAEILSLNYCTQHIPVNRTHAYMRAHTAKTSQLTNKSKLMAAFPTHAPTLVPGSARQGLFVFAGGQKKGKATFYVSKITSLSVICSHNSSVRWRQVDSAQFHISDFHDSLICWALKNKWSSPIKKF